MIFKRLAIQRLKFFLGVLTCLPLPLVCAISSSTSTSSPSSTIPSINQTVSPTTTIPSGSGSLPPIPSKTAAKPEYTPLTDPAPKKILPKEMVPGTANYFHPGLVLARGGGGDHLYNLTHNISVYATIIKPEKEELSISEEQIQDLVKNLFDKQGIIPTTLVEVGQPSLPFFQIQILVYPIERGYAACCSARLFESVVLKRFNLDVGTAFQAITWERHSLLVSPTDTFSAQVEKHVTDMTQSFLEQYQFYEKIKNNAKSL